MLVIALACHPSLFGIFYHINTDKTDKSSASTRNIRHRLVRTVSTRPEAIFFMALANSCHEVTIHVRSTIHDRRSIHGGEAPVGKLRPSTSGGKLRPHAVRTVSVLPEQYSSLRIATPYGRVHKFH